MIAIASPGATSWLRSRSCGASATPTLRGLSSWRCAFNLNRLFRVLAVHRGPAIDDKGERAMFLEFDFMPFTLKQKVCEVGPLELPLIKSLMRQLLSALACCHEASVMHRDVKPANILLSDQVATFHPSCAYALVVRRTSCCSRTLALRVPVPSVPTLSLHRYTRRIATRDSSVFDRW